MEDICLQKYIYSKCLDSKLLGTRLYVLEFILNKKQSIFDRILLNGLLYFHISRLDIAMGVGLDEQSVSTVLKFLKNKGFVQTFYDYHDKKLYVAPIINICREYMIAEVIDDEVPDAKEEKVLFEFQEKKFSPVSEEMITKLAEKNRDLFGTRTPSKGAKVSSSFTRACQFLDDIYNGDIFNPRLHSTITSLDSKECSFYLTDWKDKLNRCKGNWSEIHKLLNKAVKNYRLMKEANRMPVKKASLPRNIDAWFEDTYGNNSYFVYCFNEPLLIKDRNSEKVADEIFDSLPVTAQKGGNKLFGLNPNMPDGQFWENIKNMVEWGDTLCKNDSDAQYWISRGSEIPSKFYDYLVQNNLTVSIPTLNIEKAIECNGPWVWFLNEAIVKHNLDSNIINYGTVKELEKYYEKRKA